jgi:hypothetical protein
LLEEQWREESCARQSLEQRLMDISCALDETDYNLVPVRLRESLRQSAQFAPPSLADSRSPVNVTQLSGSKDTSGYFLFRVFRKCGGS